MQVIPAKSKKTEQEKSSPEKENTLQGHAFGKLPLFNQPHLLIAHLAMTSSMDGSPGEQSILMIHSLSISSTSKYMRLLGTV